MKKNTGINGFGRVGLHLLKYWLDRNNDTNFDINFINDDFITIDFDMTRNKIVVTVIYDSFY